MLTACLILFGIAVLFGVWYNGKAFSDAKHEAAAQKANAEWESKHVDALEAERAAEDAERKAKDEHEAAQATADHNAIGFLRGSFKTRD